MENQEILNKITNVKKGSYVALTKQKDYENGLVKLTTMVIRLGVKYENIKGVIVKEGKLPWGQWLEDYEGLVIEHKGNYYLRITEGRTKVESTHSKYILNGVEVDKETAEPYIIGESKQSAVYNIKFSNILAIN